MRQGYAGNHLDKIEFEEESEVAKKIHAWRQSERKIMTDTIQDLIQTSHKYAKSQYTPVRSGPGGRSLRVS